LQFTITQLFTQRSGGGSRCYNRNVRAGPVLLCVVLSLGLGAQDISPVPPLPLERPPFDVWLAGVRKEALERGIRAATVDAAFDGLQPVEQVLERDRTQAEFALELDEYLRRRLTRDIVRTAQRLYSANRSLVHRVGKEYGIDARILVSVWGLESNFGRFAGVRPTIPTLATLAYDARRSALFRRELLNALEILDSGDVEPDRLRGSWAGALGQPQFMPSSYLKYARDFDGDGRRDIWSSLPDVFASIAYFLQEHGWKPGAAWGREVFVPASLRDDLDALPRREAGCRAERVMTPRRPLKEWSSMGLRTMTRAALPKSQTEASLVVAGHRAFLLYPNYEALLGYNCAHSYALSVALLADRLK
jgi:peptidoglycan lytic transglycosylase B